MRELSYAPTPYSYTPNTTLSAKINLDQVQSTPPKSLGYEHEHEHRHDNSYCPALPKVHPELTRFTNLTGSQALGNGRRARPQRLPRRNLQHHHHARRARESLHQRLDSRSRIHRTVQPSAEAIQEQPERRERRERIRGPGDLQAGVGRTLAPNRSPFQFRSSG